MAMRKQLLRLIKMIGGAPGMLSHITEESPEYYGLAGVVNEEQAEFACYAGLRKERTVEEMAKLSGRPLKEAKKLCDELADIGVFSLWKRASDGKEVIYVEIFAPGTLERMVGNREQLAKHPEIGRAFDEYTKGLGGKLGSMLPAGSSLMRVIPVEKAISGDPKAVSWEKLSYYLDKYTQFSVSDCSCRAARRIQGEGCGHLEKDMCLHIGPSAEFYANTGKARWITKEEAIEILKRAEENGLMHSIPNITEPGETNAICNCCACSCFGLRIGLMFGAREAIASNYVAEVNEENCVACGQCVECCPGKALKLGTKISTTTPLAKEKKAVNSNNVLNKSLWDIDYRTNRVETCASGTAPCKAACPAHIAVQGYLRLAAENKFDEALALIKKENPFPAVCGRICNHPCEKACSRSTVDEAVAIDEVKKFIADRELNPKTRVIPKMVNQIGKNYDEKIAIIGGGPAGLSCAYYLAEKGYKPVVFEKSKEVGGMLMYGIPSFRLEKDVIKAEIDILKEMGVQFKTGVEVGKDVTIKDLKKEGYKGFYIAIGAQGGRKLGVAGENAKGVVSGVEFLLKVNQNNDLKLTGKTVVVGGGNVAVDVARTAVRIGNDTVSMYCLEDQEHMPADIDEVNEAKEEKVNVNCGWGPKEIIKDENGNVKAVVFKKCIQTIDPETKKFDPKYDEKETIKVECSNVLVAIGQSIELGKLLDGTKVKTNKNGTIICDSFTYQTDDPIIFAGGDVYSGPRFAIDAIAAGKQAAISLHRAVHEGQSLILGRNRRVFNAFDVEKLDKKGFDKEPRQVPGYNKAAKAFEDGRKTFTPEQIAKETSRCLKCGACKVDQNLCIGCGLCTTKCKFDAIHLNRKPKERWGHAHEKLVGNVLKGVMFDKVPNVIRTAFTKKEK